MERPEVMPCECSVGFKSLDPLDHMAADRKCPAIRYLGIVDEQTLQGCLRRAAEQGTHPHLVNRYMR
jgi:hypothetical protein